MDKNSTISLHTGNTMPVLGLGTWQLSTNTVDTVTNALELGYRLIDTSSDYGTQTSIGEAMRNSTINRESIYVVTKVEETDNAYEATKAYIKEIGLEYVNLMLIHRPPPTGAGIELWEGLIQAKNEGYTRDIGVSNYSTVLIDELIEASGETPTVNQIEWSPFGYSDDMIHYCREKNIVIQAYSPLTRTTRLDDDTLTQLAGKYQKSPAQILIRWNLQIGSVPIIKANQIEHLEENINVFDFKIDDDDMQKLSELNEHYSSLGSLPYV